MFPNFTGTDLGIWNKLISAYEYWGIYTDFFCKVYAWVEQNMFTSTSNLCKVHKLHIEHDSLYGDHRNIWG